MVRVLLVEIARGYERARLVGWKVTLRGAGATDALLNVREEGSGAGRGSQAEAATTWVLLEMPNRLSKVIVTG